LRSLRAPEEPLTPGFLYTGIAALSGSILTARRSLPLRILAPPTFFIFAFNHFLPRTAENTYDYAEELEDRYAPRFGQIRRTSIAHSRMALERVSDSVQAGRDQLWEATRKGVHFVQEKTGLKLGDVFGLDKRTTAESKSFMIEKAAEARDVVDAKAVDAAIKITEAKAAIQAKVEESDAKLDKAIVEVQQEHPKIDNEPPKRLV
jgi:MICOS complex subunit MIC26